MQIQDTISKLVKFRSVDKYDAFHEVLPAVAHTSSQQKEVVSDILDTCCTSLLQMLRQPKKPTKPALKKALVMCMDQISIAPVDVENREFGYQLGWFLAEKVAVNLRKGTEKKVWGYWHIEGSEVKAPLRPRLSGTTKRRKPTSADTPATEISIVRI